jgi:hypothetical protein
LPAPETSVLLFRNDVRQPGHPGRIGQIPEKLIVEKL